MLSHTKSLNVDMAICHAMLIRVILIAHPRVTTQPAIACSKLTIETLEQGVKYVQS